MPPQPSVVPWQSEKELETLKSWFYDPQTSEDSSSDLRPRAIQRVQAYQTRSNNVPSEITATALLTQALLLYPSSESLVFRCSMTLALIRFVNSLLDPLQKRDKNLPLSVLASTAGLPASFVEVRHWGTHETSLPGVEVLRDMGIRALEWLWHNYWNQKREQASFFQLFQREGARDARDRYFPINFDHNCIKFVRELGEDGDFDATKGRWDAIVDLLCVLEQFAPAFVDYCVINLYSIPSGSTGDSEREIKFPSNLLSEAYRVIARQTAMNREPNFTTIAKRCIRYPNTLAWDLLKRILNENPKIGSQLPPALVNSITMESDGTGMIIPSGIEEIEKDMDALRQRLKDNEKEEAREDTEMWIRGWRKCEGTWSNQPIGSIL